MLMIVAVGAGGALGSVLRYGAGIITVSVLAMPSFAATLFANIVGSFIMGVLIAAFAHFGNPSQEWRAFLTTGLLRGFTTFSTFSLDTVSLYERGEYAVAGLYAVASLILSLAALLSGLYLARIATA